MNPRPSNTPYLRTVSGEIPEIVYTSKPDYLSCSLLPLPFMLQPFPIKSLGIMNDAVLMKSNIAGATIAIHWL